MTTRARIRTHERTMSGKKTTKLRCRPSKPGCPRDLLDEDIIRLSHVPNELPGEITASTVWRWATRGVGGIRLETVKVGGRKLTSRQAIGRFIDATSQS